MNEITVTKTGDVILHLPDKKARHLGTIRGDTFWCERIPEKHLLKVNSSYGFNYDFLRTGQFRFVCVFLPSGKVLETTREYLLAHGSFLHFSRQGFERQIFLKVRDFGLAQAMLWEAIQNQAKERKAMESQQLVLGL